MPVEKYRIEGMPTADSQDVASLKTENKMLRTKLRDKKIVIFKQNKLIGQLQGYVSELADEVERLYRQHGEPETDNVGESVTEEQRKQLEMRLQIWEGSLVGSSSELSTDFSNLSEV